MNQQQLNKIDEEFASIIHDVWSEWQKYLNSKFRYIEFTGENGGTFAEYCLPADYYDRWSKQADMSFAELSEKEKQSDRNIFEQYYKHFLHSKLQEAYELGKRDEREDIVEMVSNTHFRPPTISGGEEISPREILTNAAGWMNCHQQIINKIKEM